MRIIENNILPAPGFGAINLFEAVFVRREDWRQRTERSRQKLRNHESIHTAQMRELLYIGFYILYFLEWVWEIVIPPKGAYRWISFEQEAYLHEDNDEYLKTRKPFAQWRRESN